MRPETLARLMPWLEAAAAETHGTHTAQDVLDACARGACALWVGRDCFAVTEFLSYPRLRVLNVFLAGGARGSAMAEHAELQPGIEAYARAGGASRITFMGRLSQAARRRNGWTAGCPDFRHSHGFYFKDLTP